MKYVAGAVFCGSGVDMIEREGIEIFTPQCLEFCSSKVLICERTISVTEFIHHSVAAVFVFVVVYAVSLHRETAENRRQRHNLVP